MVNGVVHRKLLNLDYFGKEGKNQDEISSILSLLKDEKMTLTYNKHFKVGVEGSRVTQIMFVSHLIVLL